MEVVENSCSNEDFEFYDSDIENLSSESEDGYDYLVESETKNKWTDSEENEGMLRQEYKLKNNTIWNEKTKKEFTMQKKHKLHIKHTKKVFKTNNRIKLSKSRNLEEESIVACVTTQNDVYIIRDLEKDTRSYNIINFMFRITDIEFLDDNRLLLVNEKCRIIKILNINTLEHIEIKLAKVEYVKKIIVSDKKLFVMDDSLKVLNTVSFEPEKIFYDSIDDFCVSTQQLVVLKKDKTIIVYSNDDYNVLHTKKYIDNDFFDRVFLTNTFNYVLMARGGVRIFDNNWQHIKDICKVCFNIVIQNNEFIAFAGDKNNCLRIIRRHNNRLVKDLPSSNLTFPAIQSAFYIKDTLFYTHSSFISKIVITIK